LLTYYAAVLVGRITRLVGLSVAVSCKAVRVYSYLRVRVQ